MSLRDLAVACRHAQHHLICDRLEPWAYGTHVRASRFPTYFDFNCLRLEHGSPPAAELLAAADELLGDLGHRKIEVEHAALGERLRPAFQAAGWRTERLVWMVLDGEPDAPEGDVEEVDFAAIRPLRAEWANDFSPEEIAAFAPVEEEVARLLRCRCFVAGRDAFVLFSPDEVRAVYTTPAARGRGLARRLVGAAVRAMDGPAVIVADDEDSPKELYARVGFVPAWIMWEFVRRTSSGTEKIT